MIRALIAALLCLCCLPSLAAEAVRLSVAVTDQASPPYIIGEGALFAGQPGLAVELLQQAAEACHVELQLERQPGMRLLQNLQYGTVQASLLLSWNEERAQFASFPWRDGKPDAALRLATLRYALYVRDDSKLTWNGESLNNAAALVGYNLGWSVRGDLTRHGIKAESAPGMVSNFNKLQAGRIDAYAAQDIMANAYVKQHPALHVHALPLPVVSKDYFMPFNKTFALQQPQLVQCLWQQMARRRDHLFRSRMAAYNEE